MKGAALALALALLVPLAAAADGRVQTSASRIDLGPLAPGETREGNLTLSNPDNRHADVRLLRSPDAWASVPAGLALAPGEALPVHYVYTVPLNATPGEHGETIVILDGEAPQGAATMSTGTAIVLTSRTLAVGVLAIEAPVLVLPGEVIEGTLQLANTWNASVNATAEIVWRGASGNATASVRVGPVLVPEDGGARLAFRLPPANATVGAQTLTARVVAAEGAPVAGSLDQTFLLGRREATYLVSDVRDMGDGNATVRLALRNTGDVPVTLQPRVVMIGADGQEHVVLLDAITLLPGESREALGVLALPPGEFRVAAQVDGAEQAISPLATGDAPLEVHMRAPRDPERAMRIAGAAALLGLVLLGGALAWRHRDGLRARVRAAWQRAKATVTARAPQAPPPPADAFDDLFAKLDALPESALLLDLDGFGSDPLEIARLALLARNRDVRVAYAYTRAPHADAALALQHELSAAGYVARIGAAGADMRVLLTIDAMRESHAGREILLATHDAAYGPLARAIQDDGGRIQALHVARRVAVQGPEERHKTPQRERHA